MISLTHKHQRHTSHNTAGRAPQCGTMKRAPELKQHTFSWPMSLCGGLTEKAKLKHSKILRKSIISIHLWLIGKLTAHGSRRSCFSTSGQDGLTFQEFPNSSGVDSMIPWRVVKSFSVSLSKFPHSPPTRPRRWTSKRKYTRMPVKRTVKWRSDLHYNTCKTFYSLYTDIILTYCHMFYPERVRFNKRQKGKLVYLRPKARWFQVEKRGQQKGRPSPQSDRCHCTSLVVWQASHLLSLLYLNVIDETMQVP